MFEKKNGKRFLASVMALVMLLSLAPVGALAAGDEPPTNEECSAVALPANEDNPKPVVTDEENTENTNEELIPPPRNEGDTGIPADNNYTSAEISETLVIMNPVDLLNQASDYTTELTWKPSSNIKEATFFYLKTPTSILESNKAEDWGPALGTGKVETSALRWTTTNVDGLYGWNVENSFDVTNSMISAWPVTHGTYVAEKDGYVLTRDGDHWNSIFEAYKDSVEKTLGIIDLQKSDITDIILKPFKVSRFNKTDKSYHVDCIVEVKCTQVVTATFNVKDVNDDDYVQVKAENYKSGSQVNFPSYSPEKAGYKFSGWYFDRNLSKKVEDNYTIGNENVDFYAKYTPKTYTVTWKNWDETVVNTDANVQHGTTVATPANPTRADDNQYTYTFKHWSTTKNGEAATDLTEPVTADRTYYAVYEATLRKHTVTWKNWDETVVNTDANVQHGTTVATPANPTRADDNQYTYTFKHWSTTKNGEAATDLTEPVTTNRTYYAVYNKTPKQYTVTYKIGEATHGTPTDYAYDTIVNVENIPVKEGYTFSGWKTTDVTVPEGSNQFTMPDKNVVFKGSWTANTNTAYKVQHYQQNLEDTGYTLANTEEKTGTTGATVIATKKDYSGFTYDENNAENVVSGEVTADGKLVLKLYYTRNSYKVSYTLNGSSYNTNTENTYKYGATVTKEANPTIPEGNAFSGWTVETEGVNFDDAGQFTMPAKDVTVVGTYAANSHTYTIKGHLRDADGKDIENSEVKLGEGSQGYGFELSTLITDPMKGKRTKEGKNYVYVPSETTVTVSGRTSKLATTSKLTANDTVIDLYYYLDETGTPGKDSEGKDIDTPNGQPDAWEYKATFIVKNGQWDTNPTGGSDIIVKYLSTKNITTGESIPAKLSNVPTAGNTPDSHYKAGSWDPKPNEGDVITKDMTYTYTYSWRSSGGSGGSNRPKPPVVEIPDDVPTGLNGKDHYAYIIGYGNNDVRPQNNITRAEVATIFFRLLTDETREANMTKSNGYNDVKDGDWFCCAVSTLSKMGIIKGYEDGSFKPNDPISRAEFAAIAARFDPDGDKTPASFFDVTSHWAKDEISIAANHGWIKGYEDGSFKPDQKITRAETMTLVNRVLNRLPETKDDLHKDMKTWADNMDETAWYYLAVQEATNSHYFKNKTGTKFEQWTDLRDTRDWSELEK